MPDTILAAHGRWREILPALGIPADVLNGKHQPCPICGGKDRFRFDDKNGDGDYFCSGCKPGRGLRLLQEFHGWDFAKAAHEVDKVIGNLPKRRPPNVPYTKPKPATAAEMNRLWNRGLVIKADDPVGRYLAKRGLFVAGQALLPLRYAPDLRYAVHRFFPGMIAKFYDSSGHPRQLHRTYLTADGDKAPCDSVKKFMPGELPKGGAIRLGPVVETLGIAEGIETALSAFALFGVPVWAATSDTMLAQWQPPSEAKRIVIYGDGDFSFAGQAAAYALAKRLKKETACEVGVMIPPLGKDWNDVLMERGKCVTN